MGAPQGARIHAEDPQWLRCRSWKWTHQRDLGPMVLGTFEELRQVVPER